MRILILPAAEKEMVFTSYAQNFEDVLLWRALKHAEPGRYIDVGAQHPVVDSVSLAFYEHGWRGVHVEPNPFYAQLLREHRPDETVIQAAVSGKAAVLTFFEIADTGLSTCDAEIAERHRLSGFTVRETRVPCLTLANVLESCAGREIHWLKIDVEGLEEQVLQSWQPSTIRPWIVVVESVWPLTQTESHHEWEKLILALHYQCVHFDGLNRYYLSQAHPEFKDAFRAGPNVFDGFALSGTSSASFCRLLKDQLATREQEFAAQLEQGQAEIQRLTQMYATREKELLAHIAQGKNELDEIRALLHAQNENLTTIKAKVEELNQHCHHWWTMADGVNKELQTIYASRSWRLTAPLRWLSVLIRGPGSQSRQMLKHLVAPVLIHLTSLANSTPWIKRLVLPWLKKYPSLEARLRHFMAGREGLATQQVLWKPGLPKERSQLTPRARKIYDRLKAAIETRQKENH